MKKYFSFSVIFLMLSIIYLAFSFGDTKAKNNLDYVPYQVCVSDESGNPVVGAHVWLCDGTNKYDLGYTQDNGCVAPIIPAHFV